MVDLSCRIPACVQYTIPATYIMCNWAPYIYQVNRKHGQVLVKEVDPPLVDSLCDLLANLVRTTSLDHVQSRPSILSLGPRRRADK